ncbi:unknown [Firmicutes bacterium CAG:137]|nr:unknown [Firmicutes bacterium CAG:137]
MQAFQSVMEAAQPVDEAGGDSLPAIEDGPHIGGHFAGGHHISFKILPGDFGVGGDKVHNLLLNPVEVPEGLRRAHHQPSHSHRVNGHAGRRRDEGPFGRHRQRDADGVSAPQDQGDGGLFHACNELGNGKPGLNVAADGVQEEQEAVNLVALLNSRQKRQDMLIFGGFGGLWQGLMPLNLTNDREGVNVAVFSLGQVGAQLQYLLPALFHGVRVFLFRLHAVCAPFCFPLVCSQMGESMRKGRG